MKGFTLIELMIVVAIIGILAATVIPAFKKAQQTQNNEVMVNVCSNEIKTDECQ